MSHGSTPTSSAPPSPPSDISALIEAMAETSFQPASAYPLHPMWDDNDMEFEGSDWEWDSDEWFLGEVVDANELDELGIEELKKKRRRLEAGEGGEKMEKEEKEEEVDENENDEGMEEWEEEEKELMRNEKGNRRESGGEAAQNGSEVEDEVGNGNESGGGKEEGSVSGVRTEILECRGG